MNRVLQRIWFTGCTKNEIKKNFENKKNFYKQGGATATTATKTIKVR